eukprot:3579346-Prymnesium_polylepis.2
MRPKSRSGWLRDAKGSGAAELQRARAAIQDPWLEREIAGAGHELRQVSELSGTGRPPISAGKLAPQ